LEKATAEAEVELEQTQDQARADKGLGSVYKRRPISSTIDQYMKKKSPAHYPPNSDHQRRMDLDIMAFLATTNLPFSLVETKGFKM
jgi:hypothetical protein